MQAELSAHQRNDAGIAADIDDMGDKLHQEGNEFFRS